MRILQPQSSRLITNPTLQNPKPLELPALDQLIEAKRAELRALERTEESLRSELYLLFQQKAEALCPIALGSTVEYAFGKFGRVEHIGFNVEFLHDLHPGTEIHWIVSGRRLDRSGALGTKAFPHLGPASHNITRTAAGIRFIPKHLGGLWGVNDEDH
jgi:hypothetical protein